MEFKQCNNDLIKIESENFNITIKTTFKKSQLEKSVIDDKITELRNIFATILSENQKLQDKKLLEKLLENIGNKIKNNIDGIEISLSEEMCKLQSLSDYFNKYNEKFGEFGKTLRINNSKSFHINLSYLDIYKNENNTYFVTKYDDGKIISVKMLYNKNAHYNFRENVKLSDIKQFKEFVKNINVPEGYDNSGEIKNYIVYTFENNDFKIQVENSENSDYNTKIKIYNENVKDSTACINTQLKIDNEELLEKSINIVNSIDEKEDTKDFIEEVILKMIIKLLNIKSEIDNKCDSINIKQHNKKPYEAFTNILPSIIGLNYNLSVTTNLNTAQCTYNNGKIDITMDDNCRNNIIIKADNFIKECEFEHKGFLSHRFRIKAIKTMTKMSNKVPQLSKITYDIGNKLANFENE